MLACVPKEIYIMFLVIPFLMPKSRIKNKRSYYAICFTGLVIIFLMLDIRTISTTGGAGDMGEKIYINRVKKSVNMLTSGVYQTPIY